MQPSDLPFDLVVPISAKNGTGLDLLEQALDLAFPHESVPCDGGILTNARQSGALVRAGKAIDCVLSSMDAGMTPDAVLVDVESAMQAHGLVVAELSR